MESFIYVIAASPSGPTKIGLSKHPEKRLKQLQTGHAEKLSLHHAQTFSHERVRQFEKLLHKTLAHKRTHGEWFDLTVEDAILEVEYVVIRWGDKDYIPKN